MYKRILTEQLQTHMFKGKVLMLLGPRQVGKMTLIEEHLLKDSQSKIMKVNCDNPSDRALLDNRDFSYLDQYFADVDIIYIDEGQKVASIGQTLKLLVDHYKTSKQVIVTGSSSIHLMNNTNEPLTGRKFVFQLYPISLEEIFQSKGRLDIEKSIDVFMRFGTYPDILNASSLEEKQRRLQEVVSSYLYRDVLELQNVKSADILFNLLKALALQIGSEVSYQELSNLLNMESRTVERYVDLLEQAFVIRRVMPYSRNKRRDISKLRKIYFYDLGVRNTVISNFNALEDRNDVGAMWENFMFMERLKYRTYHDVHANEYFWRTYDGAEVDLVEERKGRIFGFEFKWSEKKQRPPVSWLEQKNSSYEVVHRNNFWEFVGAQKES